jgi:ketosteroid isomerase-like protein
MSRENVERLRPTLAEWERGNFAAGTELLSPDVTLSAFVPDGWVVARGWEEIGQFLREFFAQWSNYRIEVHELEAVDDSTVMMEGRQIGIGSASGVEITDSLNIVFEFEGDRVVAMYWHPVREAALESAGLLE